MVRTPQTLSLWSGVSLPAEGEGQPHQPEQRPCAPRHPCRYDPGFPPMSSLVHLALLVHLVVIVILDQPIIIFVLIQV